MGVPSRESSKTNLQTKEVFACLGEDQQFEGFLDKEAALKPTNPRDLADDFEADLVRKMQQEDTQASIVYVPTGEALRAARQSFAIAAGAMLPTLALILLLTNLLLRCDIIQPVGGGVNWPVN